MWGEENEGGRFGKISFFPFFWYPILRAALIDASGDQCNVIVSGAIQWLNLQPIQEIPLKSILIGGLLRSVPGYFNGVFREGIRDQKQNGKFIG